MVTKADLANGTPTSQSVIRVAPGELVTAETENLNNAVLLQSLISVYQWIQDQGPQTNVATLYQALQTFNVNNGTNPDIAVGNITSSITNGNIKVIPNGTGKFFYGADSTPSNEIAKQSYVNAQIAAASTVTGIQMTGATAGADGVSGAVPTPLAGEEDYVLTGGATWVDLGLPTGAIVGTTDTQTLTNKTIDGDVNTLQDIGIGSIKTADKTGNGTKLTTATGTLTSGNLASWDANGNAVDSGVGLSNLIQRKFQAANQNVINSTTMTVSTNLSVAVLANKKYYFKASLNLANTVDGGPGIKVGVGIPTGGVANFNYQSLGNSYNTNNALESTTNALMIQGSGITAGGVYTTYSIGAGSADWHNVSIEGTVETNANLGDIAIYFAQENAQAVKAARLTRGSYLAVAEIM